ncbi:stage III sporulation protein AE [Thermaerobacter subterraneus]|uniref:Stage III sporulation protein AE n=1 Tax=Thermaerobacter subterraneus DSM 13965 TaxID=867903 RepID=K6PLS2_9FIRM|nr:stage III sporulation protein AE [Thermaerobacter subterraneus]EKP93822.1 stage III sporulation protein AE [Thermaerobacter subterraneus DSM 13965]
MAAVARGQGLQVKAGRPAVHRRRGLRPPSRGWPAASRTGSGPAAGPVLGLWARGALALLVLLVLPFLPGTALLAGAAAPAPGAGPSPADEGAPAGAGQGAGRPLPWTAGLAAGAVPVQSPRAGTLPAAPAGSGGPGSGGIAASPSGGTAAIPGPAAAAPPAFVDVEQLAREQWEETEGATGFLEALDRVRQQVGEAIPGLDWEHTLDALRRGELPWSAGDLLGALLRALAGEVLTNGGLLLRLLVLAVLLAVLQAIENAFDNEAVARAAYAVTYLALIALALVSFRDALTISQQAIRGLVDFLLASLPVLLTLMASTGALATAGILHPLVVATAHTVSVIVGQWVLPLIFLAAVVDIAGHFPVGNSLSGLSRLLRQAALVILGLAGTVFLTVVAIQGAAGSVADGIALRTAKYLVGTFIPVVGGMLSDSVELVVTSSLLLKNAVNLLGMLAVFALVAWPLLKLVALVFVYRLVAAAIQPVGPGHVAGALQSMGDHLVLVGAATAVVGLMFFIVMAVMLAAGNAAVMMR